MTGREPLTKELVRLLALVVVAGVLGAAGWIWATRNGREDRYCEVTAAHPLGDPPDTAVMLARRDAAPAYLVDDWNDVLHGRSDGASIDAWVEDHCGLSGDLHRRVSPVDAGTSSTL